MSRVLAASSDCPLSVATEEVDPAWLSTSALGGSGGECRGVPGQESAAPIKRAAPTDCTERRCWREGEGERVQGPPFHRTDRDNSVLFFSNFSKFSR